MQQINASLQTPPEQWDKECTLTLLRAVKLLLLASGDDSGRHHAAAVDKLNSELRQTSRMVGALAASMADRKFLHTDPPQKTLHPSDSETQSVKPITAQRSFEHLMEQAGQDTIKGTEWWRTQSESLLGALVLMF